MEGLCCGERDICIHTYVLTQVSHVSTHVTTRVEPPFKLVSLCRVFKACKLGDRQQGEARSEASSVIGTTGDTRSEACTDLGVAFGTDLTAKGIRA